MLPGFVSRNTPSRLSNYKPQKSEISLAKTVARSFTLAYGPERDDDIYGIYIMGSVGTIAQSESSDLDIWLCHRPGLDESALNELNQKAEQISEWADTFRLETHFFLMDYEAFKQGHLSALNEESSGSAQKLLLLDEFYRSAIFMGGRIPIWWFIPDAIGLNYTEYAHTLLHKRFINEKLTLDFGSVARIPDGEFVGAGIWQLYKAIESPYKSVLKLLLLEAYVNDHPNIEPLSLTYKELVYNGETDINVLDSYVMIYQRIERYLLSTKEHDRLELARRCFYFKVKKPLSRAPHLGKKSWQRQLMEKFVESWGWTNEQITIMDERASWKTLRVSEERAQLVNELNHSYRFLLEFANRTGAARSISSDELTVLGRKLQAAFERRPGKVEWINPNISDDLTEDVVSLRQVYDQASKTNVWTAYAHEAGITIAPQGTGIKSSTSLIELTLWCYVNGIISRTTQIEIAGRDAPTKQEVQRLFTAFNSWLPLPLESLSHEAFHSTAVPKQVLLLINVGKRYKTDLEELGYHRLSDKNDALRYGGAEENLVSSVDIVTRNSWNEVSTRRFDSEHALLDALVDFLQLCLPGTHQKPPAVKINCVSTVYASTIMHRVQYWLKEVMQCFYGKGGSASNRFIFQMTNSYFCLQFRGMKPHVNRLPSQGQLVDFLSNEQKRYSRIVVDSNALNQHPLKAISPLCKKHSINVFFRKFDIGMEVYVVDEKGSVLHNTYRGQKNYDPIKVLHCFLRAITQRQMWSNPEMASDFGVYPINFYELEKQGGHFECTPKNISHEMSGKTKFDVKAIAHLDSNDNLHFNFYCDDQEFSALSFGDQLDIVVAHFIVARRQEKENYPIYITDMDLSLASNIIAESGTPQISHYLQIKEMLETRLNQAIGIHLNA